jgi:hypothetical protein
VRLELFERIAAAAGVPLDDTLPGSVQPMSVQPGAVQPSAGRLGSAQLGSARASSAQVSSAPFGSPQAGTVPPSLLAAAQEGRHQGSPVHLAIGGEDVIAVIGDEGGDPREWWSAIHRLASRLGNAS